MGGVKVDKILTSPPYNIIRPNSTDRGYDLYKDGLPNKEYSKWVIEIFKHFNHILKKNGCVLWNMSYGTENTECMSLVIADILRKTNFTLADIIVWEKNSATPNNVSPNKLTRICEFVYVFCRKNEINTFVANKRILKKRESGQNIYENIFNIIKAKNNDESCELNKATFSTDLCLKLMNIYCKENETIFDPFMGTGTTAVGCYKKGLKYIGSEISKGQCEWAEKRLDAIKSQISMFD